MRKCRKFKGKWFEAQIGDSESSNSLQILPAVTLSSAMRTKSKTSLKFQYSGSSSDEITVSFCLSVNIICNQCNYEVTWSTKQIENKFVSEVHYFQVHSEAELKSLSHQILAHFSRRSFICPQLQGKVTPGVRRFVEG